MNKNKGLKIIICICIFFFFFGLITYIDYYKNQIKTVECIIIKNNNNEVLIRNKSRNYYTVYNNNDCEIKINYNCIISYYEYNKKIISIEY